MTNEFIQEEKARLEGRSEKQLRKVAPPGEGITNTVPYENQVLAGQMIEVN